MLNSFAKTITLRQASASIVAAEVGRRIHSDKAPITLPKESQITTLNALFFLERVSTYDICS